jgi:mRNA interferase MazF
MGDDTGLTAPKRGEVYLVNFDPTIGSEIRKTRPALVLQNDTANLHSPVTIVAAIASFNGGKLYPTEVDIEAFSGGLERDSIVLLNQVRTIDKQRLVRKLGSLDTNAMERVGAAPRVSLDLIHR